MGKLRRPRICRGCKALYGFAGNARPHCLLGYKQALTVQQVGKFATLKIPAPQEPCPKPLTWDEWMNAEPKEPAPAGVDLTRPRSGAETGGA